MPRSIAPPHGPDALDRLRELVEEDGRSIAEIGRSLDPPMSRSQLAGILTGVRRDPSIGTVCRVLGGLRRRLRDLD